MSDGKERYVDLTTPYEEDLAKWTQNGGRDAAPGLVAIVVIIMLFAIITGLLVAAQAPAGPERLQRGWECEQNPDFCERS